MIAEQGMEEYINLIADVGFPIAASIAAWYFVFLTLKFILAGVKSNVKEMAGLIKELDSKVKDMNNDVIKIDTVVSFALGLRADIDRVARVDKRQCSTKGETK